MIDWRNLHTLLVFSQSDNLVHAAEQLKVDRTTVSRRIESLETTLQTKLVDRVGRDLVLTQAGTDAVQTAESTQMGIQQLVRTIGGRDQLIAGVIRFTTTPGIAALLCDDLAHFQETHPDVLLEVSATNELSNLELLEADVALRMTALPPQDLIGSLITGMSSALYCSRELASKIEGLAEIDFIDWGFDRNTRGLIEGHFGRPPRLVMKSDSIDLVKQLVVAGHGVAFMPCHTAEKDSDLVRLTAPESKEGVSLWLLYHPRLRRVQRIQEFTSFLQSRFAGLRPMLKGADPVLLESG